MELPDEILVHIFTYSLAHRRTTISIITSCTKFMDIVGELIIKFYNDIWTPNNYTEYPPAPIDVGAILAVKTASVAAFGRQLINIMAHNVCRGHKCDYHIATCDVHKYCESCNSVDRFDNMKLMKYTHIKVYLCAHCATMTCNICYVRPIEKATGDISICNKCFLSNSVKCIKCFSMSLPRILTRPNQPQEAVFHDHDFMQQVYGCRECNISTMLHEDSEYDNFY